jgi:hypothetical protein
MKSPLLAAPVRVWRGRRCAVVLIWQMHDVGVLLESGGVDQPVADEQFDLVDTEVASDGDEIVATDEAATVALVPVGGAGHPERRVCFSDCEPPPDDAAQHGVQIFAPIIGVGGYHSRHISTANRSPANPQTRI